MSVNFEELSKLVIDGDTETIKSAVKNAINDGADPLEIVDKGLAKGIRTVGEKYGKGEIFLTELLMGAEAMKAGMEIINPEIQKQKKEYLAKQEPFILFLFISIQFPCIYYLTFHCIAHSPTPPFSTPSNRRFLNPNLFFTLDKIPIIT